MEEKIVKPLTSTPPAAAESASVADPSELPVEKKEEKPNSEIRVTEQDYRTSPLFYQVADYFAIEPSDYESAKNKLSVIVDWVAQEAGSTNIEDILLKLREVEEKVVRLDPFEKRYKMMFRYVMLKSKENSIKKALSAFEKGGV